MSNRLLGIPSSIVVAGLIGLAISIGFYAKGLGARLPHYPLSESQISERAVEIARANGLDMKMAVAIAVTQPLGGDDADDLAAHLGADELRRLSTSGTLPLAAWTVRVRRDVLSEKADDDRSGIIVDLTATGEPVEVEFPGRSSKQAAPSRDEARRIALESLESFGVDIAGFAERERDEKSVAVSLGSDQGLVVDSDLGDATPNRPAEVDLDEPPQPGLDAAEGGIAGTEEKEPPKTQRFYWAKSDPVVPGVSESISATVTSEGLSHFDRQIEVDESNGGSTAIVMEIVQGTVYVLLCTVLIVLLPSLLILRLITRDFVSFRRALVVGSIFITSGYVGGSIATGFSMSLIGFGLGVFFLGLLLSPFVCAAWMAGEADAYFAWGRQNMSGALALLTLQPRARQVARETVEGTLWGWCLLGLLTLGGLAVVWFLGPDVVNRRTDVYAIDAHPTVLFWTGLLPYVIFYSVVCLLFVPAWLHRITRRAWVAIPLAGVVAGIFAPWLGIADITFRPLPGSLSWGILFGIAACLISARRGLWTATVATFTFSTYYFGLAAVVAAAASDSLLMAAGLAAVTVPAGLFFVVGRRWEEVELREAPPPRVSRLMEQARREEELNIAHRVQEGLLPSADPVVEGFDIAGTCRPANEVGGDYFDYFSLPDGRIGIAVGDVSGKGVPAAFFMTLTKGFMEVAAVEARDPERVLAHANANLRDHLARGTFVTMCYAILDPESGTVAYARAGHNPVAVIRNGTPPEYLSPPGTALGAVSSPAFEKIIAEERIELHRGDALVFYTDGVTEAMNPSREEYGEERLLAALERLDNGNSSRELVEALMSDVKEFTRDADQHDDITLVVVRAA